MTFSEIRMNLSRVHIAMAMGFATAVASGIAVAQQGPPPPPAYAASQGIPTPAAQSDRLRQALSLRPDQETALQAFVAAMTPKPEEIQRQRAESAAIAALPTPQRLDRMLTQMDHMRAVTVAKMDATKAFYAQLSPTQQAAFDRMGATHP
jgi:periplasmic protein CpxP/Spy